VDAPVVLAVDGNSLVHRSFHAMATSDQPHWAVRGLLTQGTAPSLADWLWMAGLAIFFIAVGASVLQRLSSDLRDAL